MKSGAIGDVRLVMANFGFSMGDDPPERLIKSQLAGGALLDVGIYAITMASFAFPGLKPEKIVAAGNLLETGVDEQVGMTVVYPGGKLANMCISLGADLPREAFVIGSKGTDGDEIVDVARHSKLTFLSRCCVMTSFACPGISIASKLFIHSLDGSCDGL